MDIMDGHYGWLYYRWLHYTALLGFLLFRFSPAPRSCDLRTPGLPGSTSPPITSIGFLLLTSWYARSISFSTAHLTFSAVIVGQTLRSPFSIHCSILSLVGLSSKRNISFRASSGTSVMWADGIMSSTRKRRILRGMRPKVSSCISRCCISSPNTRSNGSRMPLRREFAWRRALKETFSLLCRNGAM